MNGDDRLPIYQIAAGRCLVQPIGGGGRLTFVPADRLRDMATRRRVAGGLDRALELELIADALEALALRGVAP